jgi:hypothetical protein
MVPGRDPQSISLGLYEGKQVEAYRSSTRLLINTASFIFLSLHKAVGIKLYASRCRSWRN